MVSLAKEYRWNTAKIVRSSMSRKIRSGGNSDPEAKSGPAGCASQGRLRKKDPGANEPERRHSGPVSRTCAAAKGGKGCPFITSRLPKRCFFIKPRLQKEKPCPFTIFRFLKGSYTVEAALVLPLFLFAAVTVLSFCRILQVEWGVQTAMHEVVRGAALAGAAFEPSEVVLAGTARAKIISDGVPVKYIWGDIVGISFASSSVTEDDITMVARYRINPLVPLPGYKGFRIENRVYARRFTGFHPGTAGTEETYVYITPYGKAYHKDLRCSYLEPDIRCVMKDAVGGERNSGGGRYTSCPRCRKYGFGRILYVTTYGKVYHSRIDCPALKRTVKRVKLKEAEKTHHICPKCGTEEAEVTGDEDITDLVEEAEALARAAEGG